MSDNDRIVLRTILEQNKDELVAELKASEYFEVFAAEQVLKEFGLSYEEIQTGIVAGGLDGGFDSMHLVLYRSPNHILEPTESYEVGEAGEHWVPNVIFTCGAVPREDDKEILDAEDEVLVYYGAADSVIGVATAKVGDLIKTEVLIV